MIARAQPASRAPATVRIWWVPLEPGPARAAELRAALSREESERFARFARPRRAAQAGVARGHLRTLLGRRLGLEPAAVPIVARSNGKPCLDPAAGLEDVRFNLSHSGVWAVIALAEGREVGVDVERHAERDLERLAGRVLSRDELRSWSALAPAARPRAFYGAWTRREAYAKARGEGIGTALSEPWPPAAGRRAVARVGAAAGDWLIADLEPPSDSGATPAAYSAALAVRRAPAGTRIAVALAKPGSALGVG